MRDSQTNLRTSQSGFDCKLSKGDLLKQQKIECIMRETINKSKIDEILAIQRLNTQMGKIQ